MTDCLQLQSGGALAIGIDEFEVSDSCDATAVTATSSTIVVSLLGRQVPSLQCGAVSLKHFRP